MKFEELFEKAKKLIPGGVNSHVRGFRPYPFFTKRAKDSQIFDVDRKDYVDYCLAYGPLILGHAHPKIVEAVKAQLKIGLQYGVPTEQEVEFATLISGARKRKTFQKVQMTRVLGAGG